MSARVKPGSLLLLLLALLLGSSVDATGQDPVQTYSAAEAGQHIGEEATVCGTVVSATYAARSRGRPTFLNLDRPYPDHVFTIVIWGESRSNFPEPPETAYKSKGVCVTGRIGQFRGKAQIVVSEIDAFVEEIMSRTKSGARAPYFFVADTGFPLFAAVHEALTQRHVCFRWVEYASSDSHIIFQRVRYQFADYASRKCRVRRG